MGPDAAVDRLLLRPPGGSADAAGGKSMKKLIYVLPTQNPKSKPQTLNLT